MLKRRFSLLAALVLASSTAFVACSDDEDDNPGNPGPDAGDTSDMNDGGSDTDGGSDMNDGDTIDPGNTDPLPGVTGTNVSLPDGVGLSSSVDAPTGGSFESAPFVGAVEPGETPWYDGWANFGTGEPLPAADAGGVSLAQSNVVNVNENITADTTWSAENVYLLETIVFVTNDADLTIEPGTLILGRGATTDTRPGGLVVTNGSRLIAEGDAANPIVFTSNQDPAEREAGDWAGVVLLGSATLNTSSGTDSIEGLDPSEALAEYGGTDDTHDCGSLAYVRIEYAGDEFAQDEELNGLTLGGCGSDTSVHHVQVHRGLDDGIEVFGGTFNMSHVIASEAGDDALDFDQGFRGEVQFAIASSAAISDDPRAFEWDNAGSPNFDAQPRTTVTLYNGTLYQTTSATTEGMRLREGVGGEISNVLIMGTDPCATIADGSPITVNTDGVVYIDPTGSQESCLGEDVITVTPVTEPLPGVSNFDFTFDTAQDLETDAVTPGSDFPVGDAAYFGAADPTSATQWYDGWTNFGNGEALPTSGAPVEVSENITEDTTWSSDNVYLLKTIVFVTDEAELTIEPGTLILGAGGTEETRPGGLVVTDGATLTAEGTAADPIVFTSNQEPSARAAGDWAGVVLLGSAKLNTTSGTDSIEGLDPSESLAEYGGTDDTHDCGSLSYVRIEFAGDEFAQDEELNGLTLGGCGSETSIDHVQVHRGLDDGIEIFGGTLDLSYVIASEAGDDALDFDQGFRGNIQFALASTAAISDDPRAFEWDNAGSDFDAEPRTAPVLANATIYKTTTLATEGMYLREGVGGSIVNLLILGDQTCGTIADESPITVTDREIRFFSAEDSEDSACFAQ